MCRKYLCFWWGVFHRVVKTMWETGENFPPLIVPCFSNAYIHTILLYPNFSQNFWWVRYNTSLPFVIFIYHCPLYIGFYQFSLWCGLFFIPNLYLLPGFPFDAFFNTHTGTSYILDFLHFLFDTPLPLSNLCVIY